MAAVVISFFFLAFVVGVFGGIIALIRYFARLKDEAWSAVAQRFGLRYAGGNIYGALHDQSVRVCTVTRGSGDNRTTYTVISSRLGMPLDVGFKLRKHGFVNNMFHASEDHVVGDPPFDRAFIVSADEPHRVRALLGPKMRQLLVQQLGSTSSFDISDHGATIETTGVSRSVPWLSWAVDTVARITAGLEQARHEVPVASPLAYHRDAWRNFALANRMQGMDTPLCMWGALEGTQVRAHAVRTGRGIYEMDVSVTLTPPLGIGLEIQPFGLMDKIAIFFGSQDHRFGDPLFDEAFRVKVGTPEVANELIDEGVRRDLLLLMRELGPVTVSDAVISVRLKQVPHEPSIVPRTVRRMLGVVDLLQSRAGSIAVGPYR